MTTAFMIGLGLYVVAIFIAVVPTLPRSPEQRAQAKAQRWAKRQCEER